MSESDFSVETAKCNFSSPDEVEISAIIGLISVSYTHLDVYKRQRHICRKSRLPNSEWGNSKFDVRFFGFYFIVNSFDEFVYISTTPICTRQSSARIFVNSPSFIIRKISSAVVFFVRIKIVVNMNRIDIITFHQVFDDR